MIHGAIYRIDSSTFDDSSTDILVGPEMTQEEWEALVAKEIPEAAERLLQKEDGWIGWDEVIREFIAGLLAKPNGAFELAEHGVRTLKVSGLPIFQRKYADRQMKWIQGEVRERVLQHNEDIHDKLRHENRDGV